MGKEIRIASLLVLDSIFFLLEVIVGYAVHSLALVADSFHMLNDIFSLVIALWAVRVAKSRSPDAEYTYGWQRAEILGALVNAVFLLALCFSIFIEAVQRFFEPQEITNPALILVVGTLGLLSNFAGLLLFHEHGHSHSHGGAETSTSHGHGHSHSHSNSLEEHSHSHDEDETDPLISGQESDEIESLLPEVVVSRLANERTSLLKFQRNRSFTGDIEAPSTAVNAEAKKSKSLNMHGVFLHVLGDALGNVGVIATALFIWKTDYTWRFYFDPIVSLFITCIIFASALPLCRTASKILLLASPETIDTELIKNKVEAITGVNSVHDLHIWILSENLFVASLHVAVKSNPEEFMTWAKKIRSLLHDYGIHSATIQPEFIIDNGVEPQTINRKDSRYAATSEEAPDCLVDASLVKSDNCPPKKL